MSEQIAGQRPRCDSETAPSEDAQANTNANRDAGDLAGRAGAAIGHAAGTAAGAAVAGARHAGRGAAQMGRHLTDSAAESFREAVGSREDGGRKDASSEEKPLVDGRKAAFFQVPDPVINDREQKLFDEASADYEKLSEPGMLARAGKKVGDLVPSQLKGPYRRRATPFRSRSSTRS